MGLDKKRKLKNGQLLVQERQRKDHEDLLAKIKAAEKRRAELEEAERERLQQQTLRRQRALERKRLITERTAENNPIDMSATWTVEDADADTESSPAKENVKAEDDVKTEPATVMGSLLAEQEAVDDLVSRYMRTGATTPDAGDSCYMRAVPVGATTSGADHSESNNVGDSNSLYEEDPVEAPVFETTDQSIPI